MVEFLVASICLPSALHGGAFWPSRRQTVSRDLRFSLSLERILFEQRVCYIHTRRLSASGESPIELLSNLRNLCCVLNMFGNRRLSRFERRQQTSVPEEAVVVLEHSRTSESEVTIRDGPRTCTLAHYMPLHGTPS